MSNKNALMTDGHLFADVEEQRFFDAKDLQFLHSDSDTGFWLGGEVDGSFGQRLHFYFPDKKIEKGIYPIRLDKDIEAYYNDKLGKTWKTQPGGTLTVEHIDLDGEEVRISFSFSTQKDVTDGPCISLTGSGAFKGFTRETSKETSAYLETLRT